MAVPKGTDVDIVTIDKTKEVLDNTDDTVFLISKDIETCLKLVESCIETAQDGIKCPTKIMKERR